MKNYYTLKNLKKVKWGVLEENKPVHLCPVMYPGWNGVVEHTGKILGLHQKSIACLFRKVSCYIFIDHREWTNLGQFTLKKILKNPQWGLNLNKNILKNADLLNDFTHHKVFKADLRKLTNSVLFRLYENYLAKQTNLYKYSLIPVYLDLYKPHLTSYVVKYLEHQVEKVDYKMKAKECFALLTVPDKLSKAQLEELSLLNIVGDIKKQLKGRTFSKDKVSKKLIAKVSRHIQKFKYLGYDWEGPPFNDEYFWLRIKEAIKDKVKPRAKVNKLYEEKRKAKKLHYKLIKDLKIDLKHQKLLEVTKGFIYSKEYRKMSLVQGFYEVEPLFKEMGKRLGLTMAQVRNCTPSELKKMLAGGQEKPKELAKRMKGFLYTVVNRKFPAVVLVDKRFAIMKKYLFKKEDFSEINYFHGQTACLGKAEGKVKIINLVKDLPKMNQGDILVSVQTNPNLLPAMKKAAAIITDHGGVTCHAAIVSRELGIPCVIGTKVATKVLKDGDKVMVDANRGDVKKV